MHVTLRLSLRKVKNVPNDIGMYYWMFAQHIFKYGGLYVWNYISFEFPGKNSGREMSYERFTSLWIAMKEWSQQNRMADLWYFRRETCSF